MKTLDLQQMEIISGGQCSCSMSLGWSLLIGGIFGPVAAIGAVMLTLGGPACANIFKSNVCNY